MCYLPLLPLDALPGLGPGFCPRPLMRWSAGVPLLGGLPAMMYLPCISGGHVSQADPSAYLGSVRVHPPPRIWFARRRGVGSRPAHPKVSSPPKRSPLWGVYGQPRDGGREVCGCAVNGAGLTVVTSLYVRKIRSGHVHTSGRRPMLRFHVRSVPVIGRSWRIIVAER